MNPAATPGPAPAEVAVYDAEGNYLFQATPEQVEQALETGRAELAGGVLRLCHGARRDDDGGRG